MLGYVYLNLHSNMDRLKREASFILERSDPFIYIPIWID